MSKKNMPVRNNISFFQRLKSKILNYFKLTNVPVVKVYNGFGNEDHCFVFGHVLKISPLPRRKFTGNVFINAISLLRLFMVRPAPGARVRIMWEGEVYEQLTESDGFFRFDWKPRKALQPGWHSVQVELLNLRPDQTSTDEKEQILKTPVAGRGHIFVPYPNQFAFISDIDDTFLISHSSKLRKRLFVLLTENAHSRDAFEGVVNHYQLLSNAHAPANTTNPFFYVSSSEWNLFDYISAFSQKNGLPAGIYLLGQIKKFQQVFKTGQNNHKTKFMRIVRVMEAYPKQQFVLLGDDAQEDPHIYASVVEHFRDRIFAVYIRHVEKKNREAARERVSQIEKAGVYCCYFTHSVEAVLHSKEIGLVVSL